MTHSIFEYAVTIVFNVVVFINTSFYYNAKIFILFDVVFKVAHYLYFKEKVRQNKK